MSFCAVFHDAGGFVFVGYGDEPDQAFQDLQSCCDDESIIVEDVSFFQRVNCKARIVIEFDHE